MHPSPWIAPLVVFVVGCGSSAGGDAPSDSGVVLSEDARTSDAIVDGVAPTIDAHADSTRETSPPDAKPETTTFGSKPPVGIQNMQLIWSGKSKVDERYDQMASVLPNLAWIRADIQDDASDQEGTYVEILKKSHAHKSKVLAMLSTTKGDVDGTSDYPYPLSTVDTTSFAARLGHYIDAFQAAGEMPDAWEIGNELDQRGFNSDDTTNEDLFVEAYGRFLKTAIDTIRARDPGAVIVTCGFANELTFDEGHHLPNPAATLARLHDFHGEDLLAKVDGYGAHVYPDPSNLESWTDDIFAQYVGAGLTDKPVWVTEWGFHRAPFPYEGESRADADEKWLEHVAAFAGLSFGPLILFDFYGEADFGLPQDYDVFDGTTLRTDEANVLIDWNK